ncbi:MAG: hypothetical protein RLZZ585_1711, partial [Bacteroidota bacterium]
NSNEGVKKVYFPPVVEKVCIDNEISLVMMSNPPTEFPTQDPLMSIKAFKIFK